MNRNGYTSVSTWRDDVSRSLGGLEKGIGTIEKKLDSLCETQGENVDRIEKLEEIESNRRAVAKRMAALYALIVALVTTLSNVAFKVFN